jgi:ABC-type sugar transport system substrate-binding protein
LSKFEEQSKEEENMSRIVKISLVGAVLVVALLAVGCQAAPAAAPTTAAPAATTAPAAAVPVKAHYKFAWVMPDMFNPFWVYMRQGAEKAALEFRAQGIQVDIQQMAPIETFNVEQQVAIFENANQMKVDGIGICVIDQTAVIQEVNKAEAAGIPVAALSTDIPNSNRSVYAGVDNALEAQKVAQIAIDHNSSKGNYIILSGIAGNLISDQRDTGFKAAIAANPGTKLLDKQPANFNRKDGLTVMENMLQKYGPGQIQGVFAVNDEAALGAMQAIQAAGRGNEIALVGIDGSQDAANAIKAGTMLATGADDPWAKGYVAVYNLVYKLQKDPRFTATPAITVTYVDKTNVDAYLTKFAEYAAYYKP